MTTVSEAPTLSSRTYGFSVKAPEALDDPISNALTHVALSPTRDRQMITDGSQQQQQQQENQVAIAAPTKSIEIIGGRSRFVDDEDVDTIVNTWLDPEKDPNDIRNIDLSLNKISSKGILQLVKAIGDRPGQLKDLDLNSNNLNDEALKAIIQHLIQNQKVQMLERLDLSTNNFTDLGIVEFIKSLHSRKDALPLRTLLLRQCNLSNTSLHAICEWISDPSCPLTCLHISGNDFTELDGIKWLADAIRSNNKIIDMNVSNCFDYVARWDPICDAVVSNETLRAFNIAVMGRKHAAVAELDAHLKKNKIRALSEVSEIERLKQVHAKEMEALQSAHRCREEVLEKRIVQLIAEMEKYKNPENTEEL